jgi:CRP/FNR family cyclic AMP-dependent transcriptional regulator
LEGERRRGVQAGESDSNRSGWDAAPAAKVVELVSALPDMGAAVPPGDRRLADHALVAPLLSARDEDLAHVLAERSRNAFDFVVIEGVVLKETTFAVRSALELLGPGDILAPPLTALRQLESPAVSRYLAHGRVALAVLDERFRQAARRWPGLSDVLHDRLGRQTHRASMHLATLHLPRVEDRIVALFGDLAERFGRMTADGIVIDLRLTHELIGRLVGSRRPTVSIALQALDSDGVLSRLEDDRWKLAQGSVPY